MVHPISFGVHSDSDHQHICLLLRVVKLSCVSSASLASLALPWVWMHGVLSASLSVSTSASYQQGLSLPLYQEGL